ncbi:DUF6701 domain-containing protein [Vibrio porteresiae]|uniref:DUF6701 domain-containing protein n=1 Tax=Vibrio porteresiae DSM 19223 TaxID=1123496 RepID=A0ABZ0QFW1_9VIBR|nr:DUF6701 domain-containing protein [Vibrio porteresiae]WPC74450.1 DUF6701 domain-containing protein [Vibrio porteresiae DSM 19223]
MKAVRRLVFLCLTLLLFFSGAAQALSFTAFQCQQLRSDKAFSLHYSLFRLSGLLNESMVGIDRSVVSLNILPHTLWTTSSILSADFIDQSLEYGVEHHIWLKYEPVNSLTYSGRLTYYRLVNNVWVKIGNTVNINLKGLLSTQLSVYGINVQELSCSLDNTQPPTQSTFVRPEVCDLFPEPVQSWITQGQSSYAGYPNSRLNITNDSVKIDGWSGAYKRSNTIDINAGQGNASWKALRVGFDTTGDDWMAWNRNGANVCDSKGCYPGNDDGKINERKVAAPPLVPAVSSQPTQDLFLVDSNSSDNRFYENSCDVQPDQYSLCIYNPQRSSDGYIDIYIIKNIRNLDLLKYGNNPIRVHFFNGIYIEQLNVQSDVALYFDKNTTVTFNKLITAVDTTHIYFASSAWINVAGNGVEDDFALNSRVDFYYVGEDDSNFQYPVIYGPTAQFQLKSKLFKGYLLAKNVILDTTITIQGAVTANYLVMVEATRIESLPGGNRCAVPIDGDNYILQITPNEDYSLTCKAQDVTFQVFDEDGAAATDYSGYIEVSPYTNLTVVTGSGSNGVYQPDSNGLLELNLSTTKAQDVTLSAYLSTQTDSSNTVTGTYHFVPYRFVVDDQPVIADKPTQISLAVEACDEQNNTIDIGYTGTPSYTSIWNAPENGVGSLTLDNRTFIAGKATAMLTMEDSGVKTVTLEDGNFNCAALNNDCPIKGNGTLKGSFTVYSRPWTFAICPSGTNEMDGNITDEESTGFTSAGSSFALVVKPIRWQSNGSTSGEIASASYCSSAVTQNFFSTNSQLSATVELTYNVAEPDDGADGILKSGESTSVTLANDASSSEYSFSGLTWSEVGVLRVKANTLRDAAGTPTPYLQNDLSIQTGYRDIGRFYPAYLAITTNSWNYADGLDDFAYMGQPISYGFTVEAKNLSGQATTNYSRFANALKAQMRLVAVDTNSDYEDMSSRVADYNDHFWSGTDWNSGADLTVNHSFTFARLETLQSPLTTKPDGSFTAGFGLQVTTGPDGVDFQDNGLTHKVNEVLVSTDKAFPLQPDLRYGRLAFSDVGGNSTSSVNVPLSAQYWNGNQFVTNTDDSGSLLSIDGDKVCKNTIWQSQAQTSSSQLTGITGNVAVSSGQNHQIYAQPDADSALREQVRFWMRINESSPQVNEQNIDCGGAYLDQPWLQFNWRNEGDEDPSTVITFGVYRGNDRVIYRGEPGINN